MPHQPKRDPGQALTLAVAAAGVISVVAGCWSFWQEMDDAYRPGPPPGHIAEWQDHADVLKYAVKACRAQFKRCDASGVKTFFEYAMTHRNPLYQNVLDWDPRWSQLADGSFTRAVPEPECPELVVATNGYCHQTIEADPAQPSLPSAKAAAPASSATRPLSSLLPLLQAARASAPVAR